VEEAGSPPPAPGGWRQWFRHYMAAIAATVTDYVMMVVCVEAFHVGAVAATPISALAGAIVSFSMNRWFTYATEDVPAKHQVWRYGLVSAASLGLNTAGEYFFHVVLHIEYLLARVISSVIVSTGWNYPLQRYFVFARPSSRASST
jgi:putative flippase GtrA